MNNPKIHIDADILQSFKEAVFNIARNFNDYGEEGVAHFQRAAQQNSAEQALNQTIDTFVDAVVNMVASDMADNIELRLRVAELARGLYCDGGYTFQAGFDIVMSNIIVKPE